MSNEQLKLCTTMAQQLHGIMIAIDDDISKELVVRILASMVGANDIEPLTADERAEVTAIVSEIARGMN